VLDEHLSDSHSEATLKDSQPRTNNGLGSRLVTLLSSSGRIWFLYEVAENPHPWKKPSIGRNLKIRYTLKSGAEAIDFGAKARAQDAGQRPQDIRDSVTMKNVFPASYTQTQILKETKRNFHSYTIFIASSHKLHSVSFSKRCSVSKSQKIKITCL
jgi:hypothetical protein